ncbi:MAG TPA: SRPBCC family protein [Flavipsychrobacter sp.]|nr:SRPBCC family protein [Flavipsychrobacter sp.]
MESKNLIAKAKTSINVASGKVWDALTNPDAVKKYMFGTTISSEWKKGSPITWKGEWNGKPYEDKGVILDIKPGKMIQYSHFSPLSGQPDIPENYHTVTVELTPEENKTQINLSQDNNPNEQAREHSEKNWEMMLQSLKKFLEENPKEE